DESRAFLGLAFSIQGGTHDSFEQSVCYTHVDCLLGLCRQCHRPRSRRLFTPHHAPGHPRPTGSSVIDEGRSYRGCPQNILDRWRTMSFEQVLQPAIDLAENGFPLSEARARMIASAQAQKILKYPSTIKIYKPNGEAPKAGEIFKNPDLARTLKKLVEAERVNKAKGRHEALKAARDRFYTGDIARAMAAFSEANGGLFRYEDFAEYTAKVETPVSTDYRGYQVYKNPSASQGPTELIALNLLEGYD